jgi:hypothetical protein
MPELVAKHMDRDTILAAGMKYGQRLHGITDDAMQRMVKTAAPVLKRIKGMRGNRAAMRKQEEEHG